ncbi:MAG: hypothetical protein UZ16_OP3001001735, partial [Candidatus Hinthialibacteria bacterium OLB16]
EIGAKLTRGSLIHFRIAGKKSINRAAGARREAWMREISHLRNRKIESSTVKPLMKLSFCRPPRLRVKPKPDTSNWSNVFSPEREEETFRKVRRAYEELRNPARKAAVDVMLFSGPRSKVGFQGIASAAQSQVKLNREIEHLTPLISESPQSRADLILALKHRFLLLARHKMWNEALKDLDQIEELDGPSENLRINRINIISHQALELAQKGLYADAAHRWRRALRYDADNPNLLHNLAICASLLINKEEENKYWVDTLRVWHQQLGDHEDNEYLKHLIVETHKRFGGRFLNQTGDESLGNQMPKPGVHPASPGSPHAAGEIGQGQTPEEPEPGGPPGSLCLWDRMPSNNATGRGPFPVSNCIWLIIRRMARSWINWPGPISVPTRQ